MELERSERIAATLISAIAGFGAWLQWFLPWWQKSRNKRKFVDNLDGFQNIYVAMEGAEVSGATRTIIFGAHNSGGIPRPGSPLYVSAFHWNIPQEKAHHIHDYRDVHVDSAYIIMLLNCQRIGHVRFDFDGSNCLLKRIYEAEGVQDSIITFLTIRDNTFFFASFCSYTRRFTDKEITEILLKANIIKNNLKKM